MCGRLRRQGADGAVLAGSGARSAHPGHRRVLGGPLAAAAAPPADAELRAERLGRDLARHQLLQADIAATEGQITRLLAATPGQILTTLPGVAVIRAASFAAHSLPIQRFPTADHLYAATGLALPSGSRPASSAAAASPVKACQSTATPSWASPGAYPNTR